jgi:hypothetical protein
MGYEKCRGAFAPDLVGQRGSFYSQFGCAYGGLDPAQYGGGTTIPDTVFVGCTPTYSMPVDHAGTAEYVTGGLIIPENWDMTSNFQLQIWFAQAAGETDGEKYAWNFQHFYGAYGGTLGTYREVNGTTTLGSDGTEQYWIHNCQISLPYANSLGTAERGGWLHFKLHRRSLGTTGEALLMGVMVGYWGTSFSGDESDGPTGTLPAKKLLADRMEH